MPKQREKARKLSTLSRGKGVKTPKSWFTKVKLSASKQYPTFGSKRLGRIVSGIWSKMSIKSKKSIVKKYQK